MKIAFAYVAFAYAIATATIAAGTASAARPEVDARTKLEHCGVRTCLLIVGSRRDPTAHVLVAGHPVDAGSERKWRVSLPLQTVQSWAAPAAHSIDVGLDRPGSTPISAALPTGLFVKRAELAFLDVRAQ